MLRIAEVASGESEEYEGGVVVLKMSREFIELVRSRDHLKRSDRKWSSTAL
jgi:hypothetical protein